jgi:UDP:flavonoid glycosyltransferase YjiC (YdhE family)
MKALFFSLPLHGHTNPTLPLVRELTERGDQIVYYSTPAFAAKIEQAGASYRPYGNAFLGDLQRLPERLVSMERPEPIRS